MSLIKIKTEPKRSNWRRKGLRILVGFIVVLVALYFVVTSELFFKGAILPLVSNAIKADVTVTDASISPFRQVILHDLKVLPRGAEPLLSVKEVRLRYGLLSMLRGNIEVAEVTVESPVVTIVKTAEGRSNLDALLKLGEADKKTSISKSAKSPNVNVKLVALNNATIKVTQNHVSGPPDVLEMSGFNFALHDLKNGQTGKIEIAAKLAMDQMAQATVTAGSLQAKIAGGFTFNLAADLKPTLVQGNTTVTVETATGALAELNTLAVRLDCDATPTEVKQLSLSFLKADAKLGEVRMSGPLDAAKLEGKLKLEVLALDRRVLNLAGAASGIDFGPTTINSTTDLELTQGGKQISVAGRLNVGNLQVSQQGKTSPTLDLRCDYALALDQVAESVTLKFFNLSGTQNSKLFLQSELPNPLTLGWGKTGGASSDAAFNITVTNWNLADWQAFAGETIVAGTVNTKLQLTSQQNGKQLRLELNGGVENVSAKIGSNQIHQAEARWTAQAQATDLKQFKLTDFKLELLQQKAAALTATATGTFDGATRDLDLQVTLQAALARLLELAPAAGLTVSSGNLDLKAHITGNSEGQAVNGQFTLADVTGNQGDLRLKNYGASVDLEVALKQNMLELRKVSGLVRSGPALGGHFEASGKLAFDSPVAGKISVKLVDFNQDGLRPFLEAALGGKKLVSVTLNSTASVTLGAKGDNEIAADLQVANLVVSDPRHPAPATPLQTRVQVDVQMTGSITEIRQCQLTLTPTDRAKNELNLTGKVDSSHSNAITGNLKLSAEALDVTRYYDLFVGKSSTNANVAVSPPSTPATTSSTNAEVEPPAMVLPLQNFTFAVDINRFYLRELDVSNFLATAKINGGHVVLQPFALKVNGAPMDATIDADLGVPGYRYKIGFNAQGVPLAPFLNTFQPERKGQIGGQLFANAQLQGAGITGASLQTNLTGQFSGLATNLNLSINNVRTPIINAIVNTIINIPELIATLSGKKDSAQMKWADEIAAKPIEVLSVNGGAGNGRIEIKEANLNSAAFRVQTAGAIGLLPVLTNSSVEFPVHISLARPYAAKIGLVNASTPTNATYMPLADFLTIKGTLGKVEKDVSKRGVAELALKTAGGLAKELGLATGGAGKSIFDAVNGVLGGKPASTNAPNDSATNNAVDPNKKSGILDLFKREKK